MTKDTKSNKSIGWFKGVLSNQNQPEQKNEEVHAPIEVLEEHHTHEEEPAKVSETSTQKPVFSKDNQDKVSLDMIVSLENMLKDRQLILYKKKGLEDQLYSANEMIARLKHDQVKKDQLLQETNKEINLLEGKLTNKQMGYDQLLEDYKEFQSTSNTEYEKISNKLEKESNKYNKLNEDATSNQYNNLLKIKELEEKIRDLEVENQKFVEQNQKIHDEKNELMQTINDFTERMSFSFSPKTTPNNTPSE